MSSISMPQSQIGRLMSNRARIAFCRAWLLKRTPYFLSHGKVFSAITRPNGLTLTCTIAFFSQPALPFSFKASPDADWMTLESTPLTVQPFSFAPEVWSLDGGVFSRERWSTWVFHQTGYGKIKNETRS